MKTFSAVLLALFAFSLSAQSISVPVSVAVGDFSEYGYQAPYSEIGIGLEHRSRFVVFEARAAMSPTRKLDTRDGYSVNGNASVLFRAWRKLIVGGSVKVSEIRSSAYSKKATRGGIVVGVAGDQQRMTLTRTMSGTDPNALNGWALDYRLAVSRRVRIGATAYRSTFEQPIGSGITQNATAYEARIEYVFGGAR